VESVKFLADLCGVDLENQAQLTEEFKKLKQQREMAIEVRRSKALAPVTNFFPEEVVEELLPHRSDYFVDRGFPEELLDFYEVGGMTDSHGVHRETIPIRDEDGYLLTVSARRTDSDEDPKYTLLKDIPKEATLYNLHVARHYAGLDRTLILVEGFVDVWALSLLGVYNAVAAMGTYITTNQARLLWRHAENIVVMLDADKAGREATPKVVQMLGVGASIRAIELPDGTDPKNLTYRDLEELGLGE
jgi:DNA primase